MDNEISSEGDHKTFNFEICNRIPYGESGDMDDPISAYFKQRCESSRKSFLKENSESVRDSSVGLIDIDNISDFGDIEDNNSSYSKFLRNSSTVVFDQIKNELNLDDIEEHANETETDTIKNNGEANLEKQRALAQQTLLQINQKKIDKNIDASSNTFEFSKGNIEKLMSKKKSLSIETKSKWFQPNTSPNTPRIFNDELSSLGGDESDFTTTSNNHFIKKNDMQEKITKVSKISGPSQYKRSVNCILKELNHLNINQDLEFESCTPEEQINRLEEDEKKFKLDNALLHNSEISQFSSNDNVEISYSNNDKPDKENKESIGQYFYTRSNRVSSLIGPKTGLNSNDLVAPLLIDKSENQNSKFECTYSKPGTLKIEQSNSTRDISMSNPKLVLEIINTLKSTRNSNESSASSSTMMVQKCLSEMGSKVESLDVVETLMKMYEAKQAAKANQREMPEIIVTSGIDETPKTSKTQNTKKMISKTNEKETESTSVKTSLFHQILTPTSDIDLKENAIYSPKEDVLKESKINIKNEALSKIKNKKAFDASTPKFPNKKFQSKNFKTVNEIDWDIQNISSVQLANDLAKEEIGEDNDVTLINVNSEKITKNNSSTINATICNIEDTIVGGDLTLLSKRIEEMKEESVCIVRSAESEEPVLLTVIQKLADLPKGSVDCTAVIPLLRDQFPELLSTYSTPVRSQSIFSNLSTIEEEDLIISEPGSWIKLPAQVGYKEKIHSLIDLKKSIFIPLINTSKNWLMLSLESINLVQHNAEKKSDAIKILECPASDFINVIMKDTLVLPESHQNLQIDLISFIEAKLDLKLRISIKQLLGQEVQMRSLFLRTTTLNAVKLVQILSGEAINFGIIADECSDFRTVQIAFNGISELPLMVFIQEKNSESYYSFKSVNPSPKTDEKVEFESKKFYHFFKEGEKQLLEFQVLFQPEALDIKSGIHEIFEAFLILKIATTTVTDGILKKIPMKSTVGVAKFLFSPSCNPLIFSATEKGQVIQKSYPVKNVGNLPIAFSVKIINKANKSEEEKEDEEEEEKEKEKEEEEEQQQQQQQDLEKEKDTFMVEKSFFLSTNEESGIEITYRANKPAKRTLILQIQPNGRRFYKIELIGEINIAEAKCLSPPKSITSVSTKSAFSCGSAPAKILATTRSLSWPAVALDKEVKQTLQVRNDSNLNLTARIYLQKNTNSFKFLNEDGEKVQKIRKVLKPYQPFTLTVIFHPDSLGIHHNAIFLETVEFVDVDTMARFSVCLSTTLIRELIMLCGKFTLSGVGGLPYITISNIKTDLSGCKMLCLQKPTVTNKNYSNTLLFKNTGPFPGFVIITSNPTHSINNELNVSPSSFIIDSESSLDVTISQKLKSIDIHGLLSERDICKLANLNVIMGDELSRLRLKELIESGKALIPSSCSKLFLSDFLNEKKVNLDKFDDAQSFIKSFFKSLKIMEIAVAVEKLSDTCEPTIFLDEESVSLFETICTVKNPLFQKSEDKTSIKSGSQQTNTKVDCNNSVLSNSSSCPLRKKIQDWLENIELS